MTEKVKQKPTPRSLRRQEGCSLQERNKPNHAPNAKFVPVEKTCPVCQSHLSAPIKISDKAVAVTMNNIVDGVKTYYKECLRCGMCYRYQEVDRDIHNFNDTLLIGLDVCQFLRECLQQHIPIGSIVKVLELKLNRRLDSETVINAYLHFDALSNHSYRYNSPLNACQSLVIRKVTLRE